MEKQKTVLLGGVDLQIADYYQIRDKLNKKENFSWNKLKTLNGAFKTEGAFVLVELKINGKGVMFYIQRDSFVKHFNIGDTK